MADTLRTEAGSDAPAAGFTEFVTRLDEGADRWFARFTADLDHGRPARSQRLWQLQRDLAGLVVALDTDRRFAPDDGSAPPWLREGLRWRRSR